MSQTHISQSYNHMIEEKNIKGSEKYNIILAV